jgi:hypothetical protein
MVVPTTRSGDGAISYWKIEDGDVVRGYYRLCAIKK